MKMIQMVPARELVAALDDSWDNFDCYPIDYVLATKRRDLQKSFITSVKRYGVKLPVCVTIDEYGYWAMGNGHHRLVVAVDLDIDIPVLFADGEHSQDFMHSNDTASARYVGSDGQKCRG